MKFPRAILCLISLFSAAHTVLGSYSPTDAIDYFTASLISTNPVDAVMAWTCLRCPELNGYRPFHSQVLTASKDDAFTLTMLYNPDVKKFITAFPGTATLKQLLLEQINLNAVSYTIHPISGAKAVNYFYNRYTKVLRQTVLRKIQEAYKAFPDYKFVFTGHSLGAALTTLAAFDAVSSGYIPSNQIAVYNFGSPRVGNQALAQAIEKVIPEFYRIVHWRDPVPHIPLCMKNSAGNCVPTSNFLQSAVGSWAAWHVGQEIFYDIGNINYVVCKNKEDPKCANQYKVKDTTWGDHFFYMDRPLAVDAALVKNLDMLTKLRYPALP